MKYILILIFSITQIAFAEESKETPSDASKESKPTGIEKNDKKPKLKRNKTLSLVGSYSSLATTTLTGSGLSYGGSFFMKIFAFEENVALLTEFSMIYTKMTIATLKYTLSGPIANIGIAAYW